jgi:uncharacterized damage-inducible protein DinB
MAQPLSALARQFRFTEAMLDAASGGFAPDDWAFRPGEANSAWWILGHVTSTRAIALERLGHAPERLAGEGAFGAGSKREELPPSAWPSVEALRAAFGARGAALEELLPTLEGDQAQEPFGERSFPDGGRSIEDALRFMLVHESYHVGQIGLIRRLRGKPGFR